MELSKEKAAARKIRQEERESPFGKLVWIESVRPNGTRRLQFSFENCVTKTEQHSAKETDLNYLIKKLKPDELANYLTARNQHRQEILGHDFSVEPTRAEALNTLLVMKQAYKDLPDQITNQFNDHVEFLKFLDNPSNQQKMIDMGILKKTEIEDLTGVKQSPAEPATEGTTQEAPTE